MILRILFIGEGSSDSGISHHIRRVVTQHGHSAVITDPHADRLPPPPRKTVSSKLQAVKELAGVYDLIVLHRDADRAGRLPRLAEINEAVAEVMPDVPHVPVIPIRMTEAWLLLEEGEIREVAGAPNSKVPLNLPKPKHVESIPDPKTLLRQTLALASGLSGRRLQQFNGRFPQHRAQLLERINPDGLIRDVPSWCDFNADLATGLEKVSPR